MGNAGMLLSLFATAVLNLLEDIQIFLWVCKTVFSKLHLALLGVLETMEFIWLSDLFWERKDSGREHYLAPVLPTRLSEYVADLRLTQFLLRKSLSGKLTKLIQALWDRL